MPSAIRKGVTVEVKKGEFKGRRGTVKAVANGIPIVQLKGRMRPVTFRKSELKVCG